MSRLAIRVQIVRGLEPERDAEVNPSAPRRVVRAKGVTQVRDSERRAELQAKAIPGKHSLSFLKVARLRCVDVAEIEENIRKRDAVDLYAVLKKRAGHDAAQEAVFVVPTERLSASNSKQIAGVVRVAPKQTRITSQDDHLPLERREKRADASLDTFLAKRFPLGQCIGIHDPAERPALPALLHGDVSHDATPGISPVVHALKLRCDAVEERGSARHLLFASNDLRPALSGPDRAAMWRVAWMA